MQVQTFSASGKLLLFGEYLVLRGAQSIVLPLRFRQTLTIDPLDSENIHWNCFEQNKPWLHIKFSPTLKIMDTSDESKALIVEKLLRLIQKEKPELKISGNDFRFDIDFQRNYGFGTSSTFISLLSQWSGVNAYLLLEKSFGGSGFDIAAATQKSLFVYQANGQSSHSLRKITPINMTTGITEKILFVYTGRKQESLTQILSFKDTPTSQEQICEMNAIVHEVSKCESIENFEALMNRSEKLLSNILNLERVSEALFPGYPFAIKSLGAWGGDFMMATFRDEAVARDYFHKKGMKPIFSYAQLIHS